MSKETLQRGQAKEQIIKVAAGLFYRQGYNATGIQQIIDEAGVSKGTFYAHFKSKDDLGVEYLQRMSRDEMAHLKQVLGEIKNPVKKLMDFNTIMKEWVVSTGYRGCGFANMAAEVPDSKNPIRKEAKFHYEAFRALIRDIVEDLAESDAKYKNIDVKYVADQFMMLEIGAITNSEIYQDVWPFEHAQKAIKKLIEDLG